MKTEIWKDIPDYENYYQASNFGNIRSIGRIVNGRNNSARFRHGKLLKPSQWNGYLHIVLNKEGKSKGFLVHRLIVLTFLENSSNKNTVNHKNGIKNDNRLINLEWATNFENCSHAFTKLSIPPSRGYFATKRPPITSVLKMLDINNKAFFEISRYSTLTATINRFHTETELRFTQRKNRETKILEVTRLA